MFASRQSRKSLFTLQCSAGYSSPQLVPKVVKSNTKLISEERGKYIREILLVNHFKQRAKLVGSGVTSYTGHSKLYTPGNINPRI